ncbi:lipopolysaccharide biosynthesis protein [Bacteroides ovatus]|jgi:teichuronic acid exporter|uniref:lipopolysaccharide biosynthesis protein n=1 Tax=Bacteroides ovatus TaxID=28116 RepID=UPI00189BB756|nr:lipopolysaccharide biosynthesis protein [Bacteroides ovatus]MDC2648972.1 lipopolysaccharide biosynthesis protein [Bacteroides ovatus]
MDSIKNQTINSAKWNAIERLSIQLVQFILGLIMARLLTPDDYGIVGMVAIFFSLSQSFIDSGFSTALIRKPDAKEYEFSTVFIFNVFVAILLYGVLFFAAPSIANFFNQPILSAIVRVQAVTLIVNSLMVVQVAMLTIKLDFKSLAKRNVSAVLISGIVGVIMAYKGFGVWSLVCQGVLSSLVNLVFICWYCRWFPKTGFNWNAFKELGAFGSKLLASGLLHTIYTHLNTLAIGKFYSAKDLGFYSRGQQIAELPNTTINGVLQTVTYPILSRIKDDDAHLVGVYRKYIRLTSMVIFIFCGLICALAKPIILFLLTDKWADSIIYLQIFAATCMFDHLSTINLNLLKVKGRSDLCLRLEIIKKAIAFALLCCSIPLGVIAICALKFIYNQVALVLNSHYTGKLFGLSYVKQFKDYIPYLGVTVLACVPSYLLTLLSLPNILTLIVGSLVSLTIYYLVLRKNEDMKEMVDLVKDQIKKK